MAKAKKAKKKTAKKSAKRSKAKKPKAKKAKKASAGRKRAKRGFKLSAATRKKIGAKSRAHWRKITGNGRPGKGNHIPLAQLKKNHARLGKTIATREKSPSAWA